MVKTLVAARVLSQTLHDEQRLLLSKRLLEELRSEYDELTAGLLLDLASDLPDSAVSNGSTEVLALHIERGAYDSIAALVAKSIAQLDNLLSLASERLQNACEYATETPDILVSHHAQLLGMPTRHRTSEEGSASSLKSAMPWLNFISRVSAYGVRIAAHVEKVMPPALLLLGCEDLSIVKCASICVSALLQACIADDDISRQLHAAIASLVSPDRPRVYQTVGYMVWRQAVSLHRTSVNTWLDVETDAYWQRIEDGLRLGDAERRKLSLDILKGSVDCAVRHEKLAQVTRKDEVPSDTIMAQYTRFCTIFETLVLARYANLVAECESDLMMLASETSVLPQRWLFVLLASGLDKNMQDQNRRYIGNWMLRTDLHLVHDAPGFIGLLRSAFMPWAVEGTLFVSSTKRHADLFRCQHGERLTKFISSVIAQIGTDSRDLLDMLLDFMLKRQASLFTSATIHMLIGIEEGLVRVDETTVFIESIEKLLTISTWNNLSDIASDALILQCDRIYPLMTRHVENVDARLSSLGRAYLDSLRAKVHICGDTDQGTIAGRDSTLLRLSNRDIAIDQAVMQCEALLAPLDQATLHANADLLRLLNDIWTDMDFLEYPRQLLLVSPGVLYHPEALRGAIKDAASGDRQLADFLQMTLTGLSQVANRRSFAFAPLMVHLRRGLLTVPGAAEILDLQDFIVAVSRDPPQPSVDLIMEYSMLEILDSAAPGRDNTAIYYGYPEGHGYAAYLDLVGRLGAQCPGLAASIVKAVLSRWKQQKNPPPSVSPWKTTLQLQVLLIGLEHAHTSQSLVRLGEIMDDLLYILSLEPLPRYRHILEWMIARMQLAHPALQNHSLELLATKDHHSNPKFLASLMKIGVMIVATSNSNEELASTLAMTFVSHSASSKIVVRHEAQWSFPQLMDICRSRGWTRITQNPAYTTLEDYIRALPRFGDPPPERIMSALDPVKDHTLTNLTEGLWTALDDTRPPLTGRRDFVRVYEADSKLSTESWSSCIMPLGPPITRPPQPDPFAQPETTTPKDPPTPLTALESKALQTKGTAYITTPSSPSTPHHRTILLASLVDNALNLGGLSRCAEIFGAEALHVRDPRVVADKAFVSVSVSSHNHLAILPTSVEAMPRFLEAKKRDEGWRVVGIEQTDRSLLLGSKELGQALLPFTAEQAAEEGSRIILVVGSEREGIPAAVLAACDVLVEIPQVGVTRSLNVQTAAAVVLFELGRLRKERDELLRGGRLEAATFSGVEEVVS